MCTNNVTEESIKVGNGASTDYYSDECKEISLDNIPGECITEVVFYRQEGADIKGMAYTTNEGTSGTVGLYDTTYTPADYEALFSSANFTLPASSDSSNMTCLTGFDVTIKYF